MGRSSISFNKKELEKKRAQKRKEKQKRKEERKASGSNGSLDEMIAYVDENGVITTEMPEPGKKQEINVENIAVSTPKKEEIDDPILKGRVEHFNKDKGYGFIKDLSSTEKYFFHINDAFPNIAEGAIVNFELARGNRGLNAIKIEPA
ncbi:MAG TPA: cold shock domain-containing protein [Draconibacterium sp.]|nr:cold shock domain-containing protein [Draconibacterium sp.]